MSAQFGDRAPHDRPLNDRVSAVDEDNEKTDRSTTRNKAAAVKDKAKAVFTDKPVNDRNDMPAVDDKAVINDEPAGDGAVTDRSAKAGTATDPAMGATAHNARTDETDDRATARDARTDNKATARDARTDDKATARDARTDDKATGRAPGADDARKPLFGQRETEEFHARWRELAATFVDEPKAAVREAESLVGKLMDELKDHLDEQKRSLSGDRTDTEELRIALRRYRSLADQILAV
jgi:hypothetical protein